MEDFALLIDLHRNSQRQGPGSKAATSRALAMAVAPGNPPAKVLDVGCGTGASTLQLARDLDAEITAVDLSEDFITVLQERAASAGVIDRIDTLVASMAELPFTDGEFDLIWSEGAVYNMGFEQGARDWHRLLSPNGTLVVSEITWTTGSRPEALEAYWHRHYPEIDTAGNKITLLEQCGYSPVGYFVLPESCWLENYYLPLEASFEAFLERHRDDPQATALVAAEKEEMAFYNQYKPWYSYGMYIARKTE